MTLSLFLSSLGLVVIGSLTTLTVWSMLNTVKKGVLYLKKLHQIPCYRCQYFTGEHHLKCTVQPMVACTEAALGCQDFTRTSKPIHSAKVHRHEKHSLV